MKIKICGVSNLEDATEISAAGADYIGLIFAEKSPRLVAPESARAIASAGLSAKLVGVFVDSPADFVWRAVDEYGLSAVQLHGSEDARYVGTLRGLGAEIWKAVWLSSESDADEAAQFPCDKLVVDSSRGKLRGGTGVRADWRLAALLAARRECFLAGGISFGNAREAVETVKPYGLDMNSAVEINPRKKNTALISKYLKQLKQNENTRIQ